MAGPLDRGGALVVVIGFLMVEQLHSLSANTQPTHTFSPIGELTGGVAAFDDASIAISPGMAACQSLSPPAGGFTAREIDIFFTSGSTTGEAFEVSIYDETPGFIWSSGTLSVPASTGAGLPRHLSLANLWLPSSGRLDVCVYHATAATGTLALSTKTPGGSPVPTRQLNSGALSELVVDPMDPSQFATVWQGTPTVTLGAASILIGGVSHTIRLMDQVYSENFDDWSLCSPLCPHTPGVSNANCPLPYGWSNTPSGATSVNWVVHSGMTPSRALLPTGPAQDFSRGDSTGRYLFIEPSEGCSHEDNEFTGTMTSPPIDIPIGYDCELKVRVHAYGSSGASFHLDISNDGGATWLMDGDGRLQVVSAEPSSATGDVWRDISFNLSPFTGSGMFWFRFRAVTGTRFTGVFEKEVESDIAIDSITMMANTHTASASPTPTQSATPTTTKTQTITSIPTHTATPSPTDSKTPTITPIREYIPVGIPDASDADGIVNDKWSTFLPSRVIAGEEFYLRFQGLWFYTSAEDDPLVEPPRNVWVKIAHWRDNCLGIAAGTEAVLLDRTGSATFMVAQAGQYRLCVKHRNDWEEIDQPLLNVLAPDGTLANMGHASCKQLLSSLPVGGCGCFFAKSGGTGTTGGSYALPMDYPTTLLFGGTGQTTVEQGCCRRRSAQRLEFSVAEAGEVARLSTGVAATWGYCLDHAPIDPTTLS